ncbi:hypothetical protein N9O84_02430, partial [Gammaproteobacteria bacterium]|nr:hypothetical protein [Gammaproteobacteria bacterium]
MSALLLTLSPVSFSNDVPSYDDQKAYTKVQLEELNQDLNSLSRDEIRERAVSLIEEKNEIEEKIEKGEIEPNKGASTGAIARLSNIYSELNLIQKILSGAGLFLFIDEIFGDDAGPRIPDITISSSTTSESSGSASISLALSNPFNQEVILNYSTSDDTAEASSDYTASTGTITFAPSETTKSISLDIIDDDIFEVDETFNVNFTLGATSLGNLVNDTASITISDDDDAPVFGIAGANVKEEDGTASITITKTNPVQMDITVNYATADGTALAGLDYVDVNDSVTFAANETQKTISISIIEDSLDEDEESFSVSLTGASQGAVQEAESAAIVSIEDNDDAPSISISANNNLLENESLEITVALAEPSGKTVSLDLQSSDGQAIAGQDYNQINQTVTFAPGETSKSVTLSLIDDEIDEPVELFNVTAINIVNAVIASSDSAPNGVLSVLIEDNDDAPTLNIAADFSVSENAGSAVLEYTLSGASGKTVSFNYATDSNANDASLFGSSSGVISFAPGETTKSLEITLNDNNLFSGSDATFTVDISDVTNATASDSSTTVTINEDETKPTISIADVTVNEGGVATLTITQSGRTSADTTFLYRANDGSADLAMGDDYRVASDLQEVSIPSGLLVGSFNINTFDDAIYEGNENFFIEIYETSTPNLVDIGSGLIAEVTIIDNDPLPSITIAESVSSRTEGQGLSLNFSKSGATALEVTFDLQISLIDAEADDYEVVTSQVTISPIETNLTKEVLRAIDDLADEDDEKLLISISNLQNAELGSITSQTLTIVDNDSAPVLTLSNQGDISSIEGDSAILEFVLSAASEKPVSFTYTTVSGTAVSGKEFEFASNEVNIPAGETSVSVQINTLDDSVDELENKELTVEISSLTNATASFTQIPITVIDNDNAPTLNTTFTDVDEGGSVSLNFELSAATEKVVSFDVASSSGTAISGTDFNALSQSVTINPGSTSARISLSTNDDNLDEVDESINIILSNLLNVLGESQTSYSLNILDNDDAPVLSFSGKDFNENVGSFNVVFSVSEVSSKDISFDVNTVADTATDGDYSAVSKTLSIPAGSLSVTQSFAIIDDESDEDNESFNVVVSNLQNVAAANTSAIFNIIDNDGAPNIIVNDEREIEGGNPEIIIELSNASEIDVSVDYVTQDGTAKAGTDYVAASGTIVISAGDTEGVITLTTIDDILDEDNKAFTLALSNPQNAELYKSSISIEVKDNDATPSVSSSNQVNQEGETVAITFALSEKSGRDISFNYATNNGTALSGTDYVASNGSITFAAGEFVKIINIVTIDDVIDEDRENFTVALTNAVNVVLGTSLIQVALDDNDDEPTALIAGSTAKESDPANAIISLSAASGKTIIVDYSANESNSAKAISDFIPVASSVTFAPGETQKTISIDLVDDFVKEPSESFVVQLGGATNAIIGSNSSADITIEDDDLPPTISISDSSALEDAGLVNLTLALSNPSSESVSVDLATSNGTALDNLDYSSYSANLVFSPGETSKSISIAVLADTLDEFDETFIVALSNATNASIADASALVSIIDSDVAPSLSFIAPTSVNEGENAQYQATLSNISAKDISLDYQIAGVSANDVNTTAGVINIPAGTQSTSLVISALEDNLIEANETIELSLSNAENVVIDSSIYTTELINTTVAEINIANASVNETAGSVNVTVSLTAIPSTNVEVDFRTITSGSATALEDYDPVSGTLVFNAGETSKTITVPIFDDELDEPNESIVIELYTPVNAVIGTAAANIEIIDDDITSILIDVDTGRYDESIDPEISLSLTASGSDTVSVDYEFINQTATAG